MPAAAVIPAPIAYIKVVAVRKLVVGFLLRMTRPPSTRFEYISIAWNNKIGPQFYFVGF